jgi:hypothetical protein
MMVNSESLTNRAGRWLHVLSGSCAVLFSSFPSMSDAFSLDNLPVSFIVKRDSKIAGARPEERHNVSSTLRARSVTRAFAVHIIDRRADARSTLPSDANERAERDA